MIKKKQSRIEPPLSKKGNFKSTKGKRGQVTYQDQNNIDNDQYDEELGEQDALNPKQQDLQTNIDLEKEIQKMLNHNNPQAPKNTTIYNFKEEKFEVDQLHEQLVVHFAYDGYLVLKDSPEAKYIEDIKDTREAQIQKEKQQAEEEDGTIETEESIKKSLRNKFNYNQRGAQTSINTIREKGVQIKPPKSDNFTGSISQWMIMDAYIKKLKSENENFKEKEVPQTQEEKQPHYSQTFKSCYKIMERIVNQNEEQEKYSDYKYYWSDVQDNVTTEAGLLPIWRFYDKQKKHKHVTSLCWNPKYSDLFAVGIGSYDFLKQGKNGEICIYSIKNTKYPEYLFQTDHGVMTLQFHPNSPAILAVGLYDGTVLVYDVRNKHKKPIYQSTIRTQKHTDPVWQVFWNPDLSKKYNFYSVSSDGRIMNWILMKNKLEPEEIFKLRLVGNDDDNDEKETSLVGLGSGLCFDFNKFENYNVFIVGTEEGRIHKCSCSYSGQYQETYKGHLLAVYKVRWNNFHPNIFISASADWTVKIWNSTKPNPIMSFDVGMAVFDAVWAPYSSTVFATCTAEKIYVYDLDKNKHDKITEMELLRQLTNLAFNPKDPIIISGNQTGQIALFKLSPYLYKIKKELIPDGMTFEAYQKKNLDDKLLSIVQFDKEDQ